MSIVSSTDVLPGATRVWVYQADRPFSGEKLEEVRGRIRDFVRHWVSHNRRLQAFGDVYHDRFVVLMVDESSADASGCSIDSSVRFLKGLQYEYGVDLFDRMRFSYMIDEEVHTVSREEFEALYRDGVIDENTLVFDTLVSDKESFDESFLKPIKDSWHLRLLP